MTDPRKNEDKKGLSKPEHTYFLRSYDKAKADVNDGVFGNITNNPQNKTRLETKNGGFTGSRKSAYYGKR